VRDPLKESGEQIHRAGINLPPENGMALGAFGALNTRTFGQPALRCRAWMKAPTSRKGPPGEPLNPKAANPRVDPPGCKILGGK